MTTDIRTIPGVVPGVNALTARQVQTIRDKVIETAMPQLVGRKAVMTRMVDAGTQVYEYEKWDHMGEASIIGKGQPFPLDDISETHTEIRILKIGKAFKVAREDRMRPNGVKERRAASASRQIAEAEDDLIFNGATYPAISGLIGAAGNSQAAASVWSAAAGTALPYDDTLNAISLLKADGFYGPYTMILETVNYAEASKKEIVAGGSGIPYLDSIKKLVAEVLESTTMPHGTGLIIQKGIDNQEYVMAEDITVQDYPEREDQTVQVNVWVRGVIVVYQANSVCKLTGL